MRVELPKSGSFELKTKDWVRVKQAKQMEETFSVEETACAKTLWQEKIKWHHETERKPIWPEMSEQEGEVPRDGSSS